MPGTMRVESTPPAVRIVEVGPRDGLQNIKQQVPTSTKIDLISRLRAAGLRTIELTSLVSPKQIPQLADARTLLSSNAVRSILGNDRLQLPVLIPNARGLKDAIQHGVKEVAVFVSASEGFSKANTNCSVAEGLERARAVIREAQNAGLRIRGYVSSIFSCPYDGPTPPSAVLRCVEALLDAGCYEVSLGDTIGVGAAADVRSLLEHLFRHGIPADKLAGHFHDTYGQAVSNVWQAYECGIRAFDSSVAGLGGCPYAPGSKGNAATEDLVHLFEQAGVSTGVDLGKLVDTGLWISRQLSKPYDCRAGAAHAAKAQQGQPPTPTKGTLPWQPYRETPGLRVHRAGTNLRITLSRPHNGNALTAAMIADLTSLFHAAAPDPSITRIAITATGRFFCTGMDLAKDSTPVHARTDAARTAQFAALTALFAAVDAAPQVTVACLNGPAFGGGVGLAFACDVRIAARGAACTLSEVRRGLCPATISRYVVREWGAALAREAMLSGRAVSAGELARVGAVAVVVVEEVEGLGAALEAYLGRLRSCAPRASALCKVLVRVGVPGGGEQQERGIREAFDEMMREGGEGAFGVGEFQAGRRDVDWDRVALAKSRPHL